MIEKKGLCAALRDKVQEVDNPVLHTFYATAIALDGLAAPAGPGDSEWQYPQF